MASNNNIQAFKGSWDYIDGDNLDEILKAIGLNKVIRTLAKTVKPRLVIEEKNGKWTFKNESKIKTSSFEFTPDVEFEDSLPNGDKMTATVHFDQNGKWIQNIRYQNGAQMLVQRWINDKDQLENAMECGNLKANQVYKRVS
ncbi:hypothetical protein I4U23_004788 [Adineta vaga]|nr:hypothetical protein I4U23_004788 [Adineta vaga]